jgi:hypothetical protein
MRTFMGKSFVYDVMNRKKNGDKRDVIISSCSMEFEGNYAQMLDPSLSILFSWLVEVLEKNVKNYGKKLEVEDKQ